MNPRVLWHLARADFLERVRRYGFLVTLAFTVFFGYLVSTGRVSLSVGGYRGVLTSEWIGTLMAVVCSTFLTLAGFYLVKNTIERDRATGVGEILAATPLSRTAYVLGKAASNFLLLAILVALLAAAGIAMQLLSGEERSLDLAGYLAPIALIALPALALVAAVAVLFEAVRWLRGALGNTLYFFVWSAALAVSMQTPFDLCGMRLIQSDVGREVAAHAPDYRGGIALTIGPQQRLDSFRWDGIDWTPGVIGGRLAWLGAALGIALLAALLFGRFDPAREGSRRAARRPAPEGTRVRRRRGFALPAWSPRSRFLALALAELRLATRGVSRWWLVVAAGLLVASVAAPLDAVRGWILPFAWIWPLALWSPMGSREARHGAGQLVFSAPCPLPLHAAAIWLAGALVAAATGAGALARLLAAGDGAGLLAWTAGCLFIPSLALALGSWSGSGKAFEILYLLLWYVGPVNRVPALDYLGATGGSGAGGAGAAPGVPLAFLALAAALFAAAVAGRARQAQAG